MSTFFPVHKFDNAFGGARMDSGEEGVLINVANREKFGSFFDVVRCPTAEHDNAQINTVPAGGLSTLLSTVRNVLSVPTSLLPKTPLAHRAGPRELVADPEHDAAGVPGAAAVQRPAAVERSAAYLINKMIQQQFIVELDHMDVATGNDSAEDPPGPSLLRRDLGPLLGRPGREPPDLQPRRVRHPDRRAPRRSRSSTSGRRA